MNARGSTGGVLSALASAALLLCVGPIGCRRQAAPPPAGQAKKTFTDEYLAALAVADDFCHAWLHRDAEAGMALLSRRVKRTFPDTHMRDAICGVSNPHHAAFEISGGSRIADGSYTFRVRLFHRYTGQAEDRIESPVERMVVQRDEAGAWLVDRFPMLDEIQTPEAVVR